LPVAGSLEIDLGFSAGRITGSIGSFVPAGCRHFSTLADFAGAHRAAGKHR